MGDEMKKTNIATSGTIITSFLAASCCIGPALFVVFGTSVGFVGKLSFLEPLRPYLLGAAFVMLGYSFWKLYLTPPACTCEADFRKRKIARGIFWVGFTALVIAASFPTVTAWLLT